jgi:hypothetical protein
LPIHTFLGDAEPDHVHINN